MDPTDAFDLQRENRSSAVRSRAVTSLAEYGVHHRLSISVLRVWVIGELFFPLNHSNRVIIFTPM
jgi:hypothetical protein